MEEYQYPQRHAEDSGLGREAKGGGAKACLAGLHVGGGENRIAAKVIAPMRYVAYLSPDAPWPDELRPVQP